MKQKVQSKSVYLYKNSNTQHFFLPRPSFSSKAFPAQTDFLP